MTKRKRAPAGARVLVVAGLSPTGCLELSLIST